MVRLPPYVTDHARRIGVFGMVGLGGVAVTNLGLVVGRGHFGWPLAVTGAVSCQLALAMTFTLNNALTWHDRRGRRLAGRMLRYEAVGMCGTGLYLLVVAAVTDSAHVPLVLAGVGGSAVAATWNYCVNHALVFVTPRGRQAPLVLPTPLREAA